MNCLKKSLNIAALNALTSVALTTSAFAFTCKDEVGNSITVDPVYEDVSMWHASKPSKEIFIINGDVKRDINEIQLLINDKDGNIVDRTVGEPDIESTETAQYVMPGTAIIVVGNSDIGARFSMSWEDDYSLYVEVKWRGDVHYKRFNKDLDNGYAPFTFPVEYGKAVNGLIVTRHGSGLGVEPLYECR
ncbi:hypothetical protein [Pseudoruegeria sp. HB172150]|uniref:hypothetical protein n=1 Tax=Pseudoruegeria sp. HB172150 TaxID=2721164 RepID=UPI001556952A|nr:hypothetical protein [Pseudoruegeria sp. HB172150]